MDNILLLTFALMGASMLFATFSAFYMFKFVRSYSGKFRKPMEYLFFTIAVFALLVIEFGFSLVPSPSASLEIPIMISLTAMAASLLLLAISKAVYSTETEVMVENLQNNKDFLERKSKLIEEKYMKRKISEDMFKQLLLDLEKDIIDTDAKIMELKDHHKEDKNKYENPDEERR